MNRYLKLVLPGIAAIAVVGTSMVSAHAEPNRPGVERQGLRQKLQLTDAQKRDIQAIRNRSLDRIRQEVLKTDEQRRAFDQARQNKTNLRQAWKSLNLDAAQKQQVKQIMADSRQEIFDKVLTAEQQQQVRTMQRSPRQGRPGRA